MVQKILMLLIPSCKEVSVLLSQAQDRPLSIGERLRLKAHLLLCEGCRYFARQVEFMRAAMKRYLEHD